MAQEGEAIERRLAPQARSPAARPALQRLRVHRVRIDQALMRTLYASGRTALGAHALGALIFLALVLPARRLPWPLSWVIGWTLCFLAVWVVRGEVLRRYHARRGAGRDDDGSASIRTKSKAKRRAPRGVAATKAALRLARWAWDGSALALGAVWAMAVWLFFPGADVPQRVALTLLACTLCAVQPVSRYRLYAVSAAIGFVAVSTQIALERSALGAQLVAVLMLAYLITLWVAHRYRDAFRELLVLQAEGGHLARQLGREKLAAEKARAVAEDTTRVRTAFITAASHDLRQPLHALGLFGHTLRDHENLPGDARELVDRMVQSVEALEGMFDELLDLSRLEQGLFVPQARTFTLGQLYARVAPQFEPLAFDKGLALSFRGGAHLTHCDASGLERILRNLLANALRHTRDGGVLVSCRRRGERLALQVWDTGSGIAAGDLVRIFDPYYQSSSDASSSRGANALGRDGLGLGLAISRYLADALGLGLRVRSRPGRGTVFTLLLPRAAAETPVEEPTLGTLGGRRIALAMVPSARRDALRDLIVRWRATVIELPPADGEPVPPDLMPDRMPDPAPELLIVAVDGPSQFQAEVSRWRAVFGAALPAIVLIPTDAADPDAAACAEGGEQGRQLTHVLTFAPDQPVSPTRLRALVSYLLAPVA